MDTSKYRIQLESKKIYSIEHVISELKRFPETKLGHIIINREHLYKVGIKELEEIEKKVKLKEAKGDNVYVKVDDKYHKISDVTILTIELMPFYEEYVAKMAMEEEELNRIRFAIGKYGDFYKTFYNYISENIIHFKDRRVQASMTDIINEVKDITIDDEKDFFVGMSSDFKNKGIDVKLDFINRSVIFHK